MLAVTACAVTRTTNLAARCTGAAPLLPKLFVLRYANMGGLDHTDFAHQIREARSFRDNRWCAHWDRIRLARPASHRTALRTGSPNGSCRSRRSGRS